MVFGATAFWAKSDTAARGPSGSSQRVMSRQRVSATIPFLDAMAFLKRCLDFVRLLGPAWDGGYLSWGIVSRAGIALWLSQSDGGHAVMPGVSAGVVGILGVAVYNQRWTRVSALCRGF